MRSLALNRADIHPISWRSKKLGQRFRWHTMCIVIILVIFLEFGELFANIMKEYV